MSLFGGWQFKGSSVTQDRKKGRERKREEGRKGRKRTPRIELSIPGNIRFSRKGTKPAPSKLEADKSTVRSHDEILYVKNGAASEHRFQPQEQVC